MNAGFLVRVLVRVRLLRGLFFPLYGFCQCILSLNACVFCRYTIMHYMVSVYMQVADCTIGFLLYLDAYHLP